ncbi:MAG: hypothetical protein WKF78_09640 [Candidatus Limnocylindrales bacterium]
MTDQVKSVITVVAKVHHYWQAHIVTARRAALTAAADDQVPAIARQYHEVLTAWGGARAARDWQSARDLHDRMHLLTDQLALSADGRAAVEACPERSGRLGPTLDRHRGPGLGTGPLPPGPGGDPRREGHCGDRCDLGAPSVRSHPRPTRTKFEAAPEGAASRLSR